MKVLHKLIILASLALPVGASAGVAAYKMKQVDKGVPSQITRDGDFFVMENDSYKFKIDTFDLSFTVQKGDQIWDSGHVDPNDEEITGLREAFLTNPVTIYSLNASGGESNFSIFDTNHYSTTTATVTSKSNKITAKVAVLDGKRANPTLKMSFNINYALIDDGLEISVTDIVEDEGNKNTLSKMSIYPGFGMSYKLNNGYFLIPDGSGALIDLSSKTHAQSGIQLTTYGKDIGISTSSRTYYSPEQLSMPMYAICDENKAMMTTIEGGQEFSELNASVAGVSDNYNVMYFKFNFKEITYQYMGLSDTNRKSVPQETRNEFTPTLHYHLYNEKLAYYDIAKKYQQYILTNQLLNAEKYADTSLRLEFLMSENKKALFGKEIIHMTTADFVKDKVQSLLDVGNDLSVTLRGYTSTGFGGSYPYTFSSAPSYKSLGEYLQEHSVDFNFNVDVVRSFSDSHGNKLAMNMSQKLINTSDYVNGTGESFYRVNPNESASIIKEYEKKISNNHGTGFDFTSLGFELFSSYYHETNTRTSSIGVYQSALQDVSIKKNMRKPNLYMFPYFNNYLDTPTASSGYMLETESIPFLSMVLSGYKSFYSSPINLNYLGEKQLLELVDYNVCPSYLLTEKDTTKLIDSPSSSYIYSSVYDVWESDIINSYHKVIDVLKQVEGSCFVKREMVSKQVYKNTYENGKCIVINYSSNPVTVDGKEVQALSSEVYSV